MAAVYIGAVVIPVGVGVSLCLLASGDGAAANEAAPVVGVIPDAGRLLLAVAIVSLATIAGGLLAKALRQPLVVGQMIMGLTLGPSVLGRVAPGVEAWLFPPGTAQILLLLGGLGAIFFIFIVGLDFSQTEVRRASTTIVVLGQGTMAIPFLTGAVLAGWLGSLGELPDDGVATRLFVALAMSVTALPVLAYILRERGLDQTPVGSLGIAASVVGNATAWLFLAVTLAIAGSSSTIGALISSCAFVAFVAALWFGARPALAFLDTKAAVGSARPVLALSVLLLAALATYALGVDAIVGAFLAGLILPRSAGYRTINSKIEGLTEWLLLPMFFVSIGLQTRIGTLESGRDILLCLVILAVAVLGKAGSALLTARALTLDWRSGAQLAAMTNCRGITTLIVLNVGLSAGILNEKLFTIFTIMAILTTMMTGPALGLIERFGQRRRGVIEEEARW